MFTGKVVLAALLTLSAGLFDSTEDLLISESATLGYQAVHLEGWEENFNKAKEKAAEENLPILMAFLGPKWCSWSDQLESKVLSTQNFLEGLKKEVVFFKVDLAETPLQIHAKDALALELKERYHIEECPSLVLLTPKGEMIAKIDCFSLEEISMTEHVKQILADFRQLQGLKNPKEIKKLSVEALQTSYVKAAQFADTTLKDFFFEAGLKKDKSPYFLLEKYGKQLLKGRYQDRSVKRIRNKIIARDPENAFGARRRLALIDFEALSNFQKPLKVDSVIKPLTEYLKKFGEKDPENSWKIEMKISQYLFGHNQIKASLEHARRSLQLAPLSASTEVQSAIDFLNTQLVKETTEKGS